MTKTLKELQEEFPYMCRTCGAPDQFYCYKFGHDSDLRIRLFEALIAAKREDEKEIEGLSRKLDETFCEAHRQGSYLRDQLSAAQATIAERERDLLVQAGRSDGKNIIIRELEAKLSAERQAHAATKEELWKVCRSAYSFTIGKDELECLNNRLDNVWEAVEEADKYLAREAQRAADAAKEE